MTITIEQINGVNVRDFHRQCGKKLLCIAACIMCGVEREVQVSAIKLGRSHRCRPCTDKINSEARKTHGMTGHSIYAVWQNMTRRCIDPENKAYKNYGGRGITVCAEWQDAALFIKWALANGYSSKLTIDRIDNDKGYSPENCRWSTWETQHQNNRLLRSNNTSGYRGVSRSRKRWIAYVSASGIRHSLGIFDTALEAAHARDAYVISHNFEHTLNFPNHSFTGS